MTRLDAEHRRLFLTATPGGDDGPFHAGPEGATRALILELASPATWADLSRVWQGVQADLDLPAPAIALTGAGGYQLWLSVAEPVASDRALRFLEGLRRRYLAEVRDERVRLQPAVAALPPAEVAPGRWSAFVTADLAALFADEPWLDQPPGIDAQSEVLSRVASASAAQFGRACEWLEPRDRSSGPASVQVTGPDAGAGPALDPREFLLGVMRDPAVDLHLRIDAAKALLPLATRR